MYNIFEHHESIHYIDYFYTSAFECLFKIS